MSKSLLVGVVVWLSCATTAFAQSGRCTAVEETVGTDVAGTEAVTTRPARVCSVQLIADSANAACVVCDTPDSDGLCSHGQAVMLAEPGVATAGESQIHSFGEPGIRANMGIGVRARRGRCLVQWGS